MAEKSLWDRFSAGEVGFAGVPTPFVDYGSNIGSGFIGVGQIGCDYQFAPKWVIGIHGQAAFGNINSSKPVGAFPGVIAVFDLKNTETPAGRLGYTLAPTVLTDVKAGAAWSSAYLAAPTELGLGETANFLHYRQHGGRRRRVDVCAGLVSARRI